MMTSSYEIIQRYVFAIIVLNAYLRYRSVFTVITYCISIKKYVPLLKVMVSERAPVVTFFDRATNTAMTPVCIRSNDVSVNPSQRMLAFRSS